MAMLWLHVRNANWLLVGSCKGETPLGLGTIIRRELKAALAECPAEPTAAQSAEEMISTAQIAKELDVSEDLVRLWVREKGCPHIRIGEKKLRYRFGDVVAWLEEKSAV